MDAISKDDHCPPPLQPAERRMPYLRLPVNLDVDRVQGRRLLLRPQEALSPPARLEDRNEARLHEGPKDRAGSGFLKEASHARGSPERGIGRRLQRATGGDGE